MTTPPHIPQPSRRSEIAPVVYGAQARVRWWERIRALMGLGAMVVVLGLALAAFIGATFFVGGFLLEQLVAG
jgi:hypothetical protein